MDDTDRRAQALSSYLDTIGTAVDEARGTLTAGEVIGGLVMLAVSVAVEALSDQQEVTE
jgi:hypothetical protein